MQEKKPQRPRRGQQVKMPQPEPAAPETIADLLPYLVQKFQAVAQSQAQDSQNVTALGEQIQQKAGYMNCLSDLHNLLSVDDAPEEE